MPIDILIMLVQILFEKNKCLPNPNLSFLKNSNFQSFGESQLHQYIKPKLGQISVLFYIFWLYNNSQLLIHVFDFSVDNSVQKNLILSPVGGFDCFCPMPEKGVNRTMHGWIQTYNVWGLFFEG